MSTRRERWLRTSCPVSDPAQSDVRREYEANRQAVRLARHYRSVGEDDWIERMGDEAEKRLRQLEAIRPQAPKEPTPGT